MREFARSWSVLVVGLMLWAGRLAAQTTDPLLDIRQQMQDLLLLAWGQLAALLVLVAVCAAILGRQR